MNIKIASGSLKGVGGKFLMNWEGTKIPHRQYARVLALKPCECWECMPKKRIDRSRQKRSHDRNPLVFD